MNYVLSTEHPASTRSQKYKAIIDTNKMRINYVHLAPILLKQLFGVRTHRQPTRCDVSIKYIHIFPSALVTDRRRNNARTRRSSLKEQPRRWSFFVSACARWIMLKLIHTDNKKHITRSKTTWHLRLFKGAHARGLLQDQFRNILAKK